MSQLWKAKNLVQPSNEVILPGETVPEMFWNAVAQRQDSVWLREKEWGIWQSLTWREAGKMVKELANGLLSLGFQTGDTASILSNTVKDWVLADLAILSVAGVSNGIYPTDSAEQVQYLSMDSNSSVLFVENDEQLDKVLEAWPKLPALKYVFVFDMEGLSDLSHPQVMSLAKLAELGRIYEPQNPQALKNRWSAIKPSDLAILVYTSGTTGKPKGAMHLHEGIVYSVRGYSIMIPQVESDERMCFLPLCHIAERIGGEYLSVYTGCRLNFVENPETIPENVREIAPTIFLAVPRIWEKFYSAVVIGLKEATWLQNKTYLWGISVGSRISDLVIAEKPVPMSLKIQFVLAQWFALNNIRKSIGVHRCRVLVTGAAPISPDLIRWYLALGLPMLEVWGMTETCGASTAMLTDRIKPGSIGKSCVYNEVKLDSQTSEILVRGKNVFHGYLNLPEKTKETIDKEGWLHTGDVGKVDEYGFFYITDRMKDIIITAGGKNITPSEYENALKFSPYITDAVVIGDKKPYLTAIIMIDRDNVERYAQENDVPYSDYASLTRSPEILGLIDNIISEVNKKFARVEQVKKFWLLDTQLSPEDGELTPTMKLKRKFIYDKYATQIQLMYQ